MLLALVVAACGSATGSSSSVTTPPLVLPGWRAVPDEPGISELAPDLSGLRVTGRADSPALVHEGDVIRATRFVFADEGDAAEALARARDAGYAAALEQAFRGAVISRTARPGRVGYRLTVRRPAEAGQDTVELYVLRRGRTLSLVELVSAAGFEPTLRDRILNR